MKSKQPRTYGVGIFFSSCILVIETFIYFRTGRLTWNEFVMVILFCILVAGLMLAFFRHKRKKARVKIKKNERDKGTVLCLDDE